MLYILLFRGYKGVYRKKWEYILFFMDNLSVKKMFVKKKIMYNLGLIVIFIIYMF